MSQQCPHCLKFNCVKAGFFLRQEDHKRIQRFRCKECSRYFSKSTFTLEYRQKKRRPNYPLFKLLCSKITIRRAAMLLGLNKNTVMKKIVYLAAVAREKQQQFLEHYPYQIDYIQFDDLITKEQTKFKPLTVTIVIDADTRNILGMKVAQIPAFGLLAKKAIEKYGPRPSLQKEKAEELFAKIAPYIAKDVLIKTDEHKLYPEFIEKFFPQAEHRTYKSDRAAVVGQGEMKRNSRDPLFAINHTCAMLRDNISRLLRRSWCLSQKASMLQHHLDIFTYFYNQIYLPSL